MNLLKQAVAATVLTLSSAVAMAALPSVPNQPVAIPSGAPVGTSGSTGGGLLVAVWDSLTNSSLVQYLGFNYSTVNGADMSAAGASLNFGVLDKFNTTFADAINSGNTGRLQYMVVATLPQNTEDVATAYGVRATGAGNFASILNSVGDAAGFSQASGNVATWIAEVLNFGSIPAPNQCGKSNSCVLVGTPENPAPATDARNWGNEQGTLGGDLGSTIPTSTSFASAVGTAMAFFETTTDGFQNMISSQISGTNTWLLSANGTLTYGSPVPLPAAAWLLLSGLAGLGAVGRRSQKA